ncbi:hypothetical protein QBC46DRAFT_459005 [Diplogelasinospora grovesii]|uniref:Heterokaryon incompatibility domain-containing protein n=1 Tax=Diplogelasinospora grovesii TaxID=303347 RepID=A0AAN6N793_9PEZI|nr:hypothetical protein QBC46DRAFT_459005 [Diplogelasinospora grovesii]
MCRLNSTKRRELLDFTVDRFIIGSGPGANSSVAARERRRVESKKAEAKFRIKSGRGLQGFASFGELRVASGSVPFRYNGGDKITDTTTCSLSWEVDGRQDGQGSRQVNSTRRIRMTWVESTENTQEVSLVFMAPLDPLRPHSDATSRWERETSFLGRELGDQTQKHALVKSWLDVCLKEHTDACLDTHNTEEDFRTLVKETYFGVIDVADMQLKSLPTDCYVWGKEASDYMTTRTNIMTYIQHGGLETVWGRLPQTIKDAILLVSRLGTASAMHLVYGHAVFTICAAEGSDSTAELPAVASVLRNRSQDKEANDAAQMSAECAPGVRLMVTRPLEAVVKDSEWNTRAWTFQERVLSRRCLIFAEGRVYFQCRLTGISQDIHTGGGRGSGWSLDRTNSPLRTLRELQQRPMWFYMKYISMYTGRNLTKPRDILAAFEGISWLLGYQFPTWSWSGWMDGRIEYEPDMIDGCLLNIGDWLKHHTWIQWHIRDEKGHLRPLWGVLSRTDEDDSRWQGYPTLHPRNHTPERNPPRRSSGERERERAALLRDRDRDRDTPPRYPYYPQSPPQSPPPPPPPRTPRRQGDQSEGDSDQSIIALLPHGRDARCDAEKHRDRDRGNGRGRDHDCDPLSLLITLDIEREPWEDDVTEHPTRDDHDDPVHRSEGDGRVACLVLAPSRRARFEDRYGRIPPSDTPEDKMFSSILPDNPFGVIRNTAPHFEDLNSKCMPVLQFWTWFAGLHVGIRDKKVAASPNLPCNGTLPEERATMTEINKADNGLCECDIVDAEGDWCGSIILEYARIGPQDGHMFPFIAISDAKAFTMSECPDWTYYIPKERNESEWDLYYVLLLERNEERGLWERIGLGKVFKMAFREHDWREIKLG